MIYGLKNYCEFGLIGVGMIFGWIYFGKWMVGCYGGKKIIICGLIIFKVDSEYNLFVVKGFVFGKFGVLFNICLVLCVGVKFVKGGK